MPALSWLMNLDFAGGAADPGATVSESHTLFGTDTQQFGLNGTDTTSVSLFGSDDEEFSVIGG